MPDTRPGYTVGLVSSYRDGALTAAAARSLLGCCDRIYVAEGAVGENPDPGDAAALRKELRREPRIQINGVTADTDANKRTEMLDWARGYRPPEWIVVLDSDELLVHADQLPVQLWHMERLEANGGGVQMGCHLRLVELDGSVSAAMARVLRAPQIDRWLFSSYHLLLANGVPVALPNVQLLRADEPDYHVPANQKPPEAPMARRRPLHGEPHILHRSAYRDPARVAARLSQVEAVEVKQTVDPFAGVDRTAERGVPIWLPSQEGVLP